MYVPGNPPFSARAQHTSEPCCLIAPLAVGLLGAYATGGSMAKSAAQLIREYELRSEQYGLLAYLLRTGRLTQTGKKILSTRIDPDDQTPSRA